MRRNLLVLALLVSFPVLATEQRRDHLSSSSQANSSATQNQRQGQGQEQAQRQSQTAKGGAGGAGGVASLNAGDLGGNAAVDTNVNVNTETKRNAPPITGMPAAPTADFMICPLGGGSGTNGGGILSFCYKDRDLYAIHRAQGLASMGLYQASAEAYCSRKKHYRDFEDQEACEVQYAANLERPVPVNVVVEGVEMPEPSYSVLAHTPPEVQAQQATLAEQTEVIRALQAQMRRVEANAVHEREREAQKRRDKERADAEWDEKVGALEEKLRASYE